LTVRTEVCTRATICCAMFTPGAVQAPETFVTLYLFAPEETLSVPEQVTDVSPALGVGQPKVRTAEGTGVGVGGGVFVGPDVGEGGGVGGGGGEPGDGVTVGLGLGVGGGLAVGGANVGTGVGTIMGLAVVNITNTYAALAVNVTDRLTAAMVSVKPVVAFPVTVAGPLKVCHPALPFIGSKTPMYAFAPGANDVPGDSVMANDGVVGNESVADGTKLI
jgi:hypothetical protein